MFNFARLFSYTRRLEDELTMARVGVEQERLSIERERDQAYQSLVQIEVQYASQIEWLQSELRASRSERQFLQDRLLQARGMAPIFSASDGELEARASSSSVPPAAREKRGVGPRQAVQERGKEDRAVQRAIIDAERDKYLKELEEERTRVPKPEAQNNGAEAH